VTAPQLAETCGIRLSTAQYHTAKLSEAGLVRGIRDGRVVRWHPMAAS
jgi:DNA-binding transcriptional ArsR family regulator